MDSTIERRRSKRFRDDAICARVSLVDQPELQTEPCTLVDLSFGGMCVRTRQDLQPGGVYVFLLDLGAPFNDLVMVKARVCWTRGAVESFVAGAQFTESTRGWLGPDE